jgi:hypothetical protein
VPATLQSAVSRLIDAYKLPSGAGVVLGAVACPRGKGVGASFADSDMSLLGRALLLGVVAENPPMAVSEEDELPNGGEHIATSENAVLYGHPIGDGNSYSVRNGALVQVTDIRYSPGDELLPKIAPPVELPKPLFGGFDAEAADATYAALNADNADARRLLRALDWCRLVLSNSEAVGVDVRVGAARSAFEALTGAGDETKHLVRAFGRLRRDEHTAEQSYDSVFWVKGGGSARLTADEWWMTRLCDLRNHIVHGDEISESLCDHDGHHQMRQVHDRLISCLKIVIARQADTPWILEPRVDRVFRRAHEAAERYLANS